MRVAGKRYPQIGDHWHAPYTVNHLRRGSADGRGFGTARCIPTATGGSTSIRSPAVDVGRNATLQRYFASVGFELDDDRIKLPSGEEYSNEDECPSGDAGEVFLRVNGIRIADVASFVPRNDDIVEVGFGIP